MNQWYPTSNQIDTPEKLHATLKQVLDLHYGLANQHNDLQRRVAAMPLPAKAAPTGNAPATTSLLGLPVGPVDITTLTDGVKLTYDKKSRSFIFK